MTDKALFLCPTCAVLARRLRPELDAGIVELDANAKCPLCGSDAVVSVHRLGSQVSPSTASTASFPLRVLPKSKPRNDILNFLIENCPEAALWWDGWYSRVNDDWLFAEGVSGLTMNRVSITLQNQDGSEAVVVLPVRTDLTTWSLLEPKVQTKKETET